MHPEALDEEPREAGIGQRKECQDRASDIAGAPASASGSHLPVKDTVLRPLCGRASLIAPYRLLRAYTGSAKLASGTLKMTR